MTTRQNIDSRINELDKEQKNSQRSNRFMRTFYELGMVFTGVLGFFNLFANPWLGIPLLATAVAFKKGEIRVRDMGPAHEKRLASEKSHLKSLLDNGLDVSDAAIQRRATAYQSASQKFDDAESHYQSAKGADYLTNAVVAGGTIAACVISSPIIGLIPVVGVIAKHYADKNLVKKNEEYELCSGIKNNLKFDHHTSIYARRQMARRRLHSNSNTNANTNAHTQTRQATSTTQSQVRAMPSPNERAVEEYIQNIASNHQTEKGVQKRKI